MVVIENSLTPLYVDGDWNMLTRHVRRCLYIRSFVTRSGSTSRRTDVINNITKYSICAPPPQALKQPTLTGSRWTLMTAAE